MPPDADLREVYFVADPVAVRARALDELRERVAPMPRSYAEARLVVGLEDARGLLEILRRESRGRAMAR